MRKMSLFQSITLRKGPGYETGLSCPAHLWTVKVYVFVTWHAWYFSLYANKNALFLHLKTWIHIFIGIECFNRRFRMHIRSVWWRVADKCYFEFQRCILQFVQLRAQCRTMKITIFFYPNGWLSGSINKIFCWHACVRTPIYSYLN